jgi:hypothetical protein
MAVIEYMIARSNAAWIYLTARIMNDACRTLGFRWIEQSSLDISLYEVDLADCATMDSKYNSETDRSAIKSGRGSSMFV